MIQRSLCALSALALIAFAFCSQAQPPGAEFKIVKTIKVGGEGAWDYLTFDAEARRLYITRSSHVMVLDVDQGKVVGDIPMTKGVHGVALVPKLGRGFTSNGGDSSVTIFDTKSLKEIARVNVGSKPDAILFDPASERVFTFNAGSSDATALDAATGKVVGTIKLGGRPESAAADEKGLVFVNIEDKNEVVVFDAKDLTVKNRWPLAPGKTPTGMALDRSKGRLFSTCRNEKMIILDMADGKMLADLPIGKGTDACVFDAATGLAFSSNKDGTLTVVEEAGGKYRVKADVKTQYGAKTMVLDPKTHNIYLATAEFKMTGKKAEIVPNTFSILVVGK